MNKNFSISKPPMQPIENFQGKNIVITGASSGIGQAIAIDFARAGANVVINYARSKKGAEFTLQQCEAHKQEGQEFLVIQADISKEAQVKRMITTTLEAWGHIDILINNAGVQKEIPSHELSEEDWHWVININLTGVFLCSREVINHFLDKNIAGNIINISSPHEMIPKPGYLPYASSKAGLGALTRTLALEYGKKGIRVNNVAPGATATPMNNSWKDDPEKRSKVEAMIPIGFVAESEQISPAVLFLASDRAAYITGVTLYVDGGAVLYPSYAKNWSS